MTDPTSDATAEPCGHTITSLLSDRLLICDRRDGHSGAHAMRQDGPNGQPLPPVQWTDHRTDDAQGLARAEAAEEIAQAIEKRAAAIKGIAYEDYVARTALSNAARIAREIGARRD